MTRNGLSKAEQVDREAVPAHQPTFYSSRYGRQVVCVCGWQWGDGNAIDAQLKFGDHLITVAREERTP